MLSTVMTQTHELVPARTLSDVLFIFFHTTEVLLSLDFMNGLFARVIVCHWCEIKSDNMGTKTTFQLPLLTELWACSWPRILRWSAIPELVCGHRHLGISSS